MAAAEATAGMAMAASDHPASERRGTMRSSSSLIRRLLWLLVAGLPATAAGQETPRVTSIPRDPLELAAGQIEPAESVAQRSAALQFLSKGRNSYLLRNLHQPWDLWVRFSVDSLGQTSYDGEWEMEDVFAPGQGLHWTAKSAAGYEITGIFGTKQNYAEASADVVPLRLQEARAMLYNPLPSVAYAEQGSIRTVAATFHAAPVVCVLLSSSRNASRPPDQRGWEESEDCFDTQSGLLRMHSEAPGRYTLYDYRNTARLGSHVMPGTITVTEAGRVVSKISVTSLQAIPSVDPVLFVPTAAMLAAGPAVAMSAATKITRIHGNGPFTAATSVRPVVVFGMTTPAGRLAEAHSLQPSDTNSDAAIRDAQGIDFSPSQKAGAPPQQRFVFVIEKFVTQQ
jgi:hypothetical protein